MIEFQDPDEKYDFDQVKKRESKVRIRIFTMLIIFLMFVLMLAGNNFRFDVIETFFVPVRQQCDPVYSYDSEDSISNAKKNAEYVLKQNLKMLDKLNGFIDGSVEVVGDDSRQKNFPLFLLKFDSTGRGEKIPESICGYKVKVIYK